MLPTIVQCIPSSPLYSFTLLRKNHVKLTNDGLIVVLNIVKKCQRIPSFSLDSWWENSKTLAQEYGTVLYPTRFKQWILAVLTVKLIYPIVNYMYIFLVYILTNYFRVHSTMIIIFNEYHTIYPTEYINEKEACQTQ